MPHVAAKCFERCLRSVCKSCLLASRARVPAHKCLPARMPHNDPFHSLYESLCVAVMLLVALIGRNQMD